MKNLVSLTRLGIYGTFNDVTPIAYLTRLSFLEILSGDKVAGDASCFTSLSNLKSLTIKCPNAIVMELPKLENVKYKSFCQIATRI